MKRTKVMNKSRFRKSFIGFAVAAAVTFTLSGCEKADETVKLYTNSEQCAKESGNTLEQCKTAEKEAQRLRQRPHLSLAPMLSATKSLAICASTTLPLLPARAGSLRGCP